MSFQHLARFQIVGVGSKTGTYAGKVVAKLLSTRKPYGRFWLVLVKTN